MSDLTCSNCGNCKPKDSDPLSYTHFGKCEFKGHVFKGAICPHHTSIEDYDLKPCLDCVYHYEADLSRECEKEHASRCMHESTLKCRNPSICTRRIRIGTEYTYIGDLEFIRKSLSSPVKLVPGTYSHEVCDWCGRKKRCHWSDDINSLHGFGGDICNSCLKKNFTELKE